MSHRCHECGRKVLPPDFCVELAAGALACVLIAGMGYVLTQIFMLP
jgi:uncharacterized OB-fold protein